MNITLNDIVALDLYNPDKTTVSPPFNVANITALDTLTLPSPFKQIKTNASEDGVIEALGDTFTCKATYAKSGVHYLYTYNIEITLSPNNSIANLPHASDYADDFLMVATIAEGKRYLINVSAKDKQLVKALGFEGLYDSPQDALKPLMRLA